MANHRLGKLDERRLQVISQVCDEILEGKLDAHFPLAVWQTGSGTQSNMNVNEVIAGRGNEIAGEKLIHPNDHANMSQSSNDTFPTAMHIAAAMEIEDKLIPAIDLLSATFGRLMEENEGIIKTGRTHLQDATPITFSQEISGWKNMLDKSKEMISLSLKGLKELALGGTAVGTALMPRRALTGRWLPPFLLSRAKISSPLPTNFTPSPARTSWYSPMALSKDWPRT